MLSLLQEQGKCRLWKYAQCAFCGRRTLPAAHSPQRPQHLILKIIANTTSSYSHTPSLASTAVSPIPRSAFSIWAASVPTSMNFPSASTWSPTSTSSCPPKPSKPPVSAPTSKFLSLLDPFHPHPHRQLLTGFAPQVSRQSRRQRRFPSPRPRPPVPRRPHQQDVVVCRCR